MIGNLIKSLFGGDVSEVEIPQWMGLILHSEDDLLKGAGHKYIRRVPTGNPKKPWKYFYKVSGGSGLGHHSEFIEGAAFKVAHNGKEGHFHILGVDGDKIKIKHDESGEESTLTKDALTSLLHKEHAQAIGAHKERLKKELAAVSKHGSEKQKAKIQAEATKAGVSEDKPKSKEDLEYDLVEQRSGEWVRDLAKKYGLEVKRMGSGLQIVDGIGRAVHPLIDIQSSKDHVEDGLQAHQEETKKKAARAAYVKETADLAMKSAGLSADFREAGLDSVLQEIDKIETSSKKIPEAKIRERREEIAQGFATKYADADQIPLKSDLIWELPTDRNGGAELYHTRLEHAVLNAILKIREHDKDIAKNERRAAKESAQRDAGKKALFVNGFANWARDHFDVERTDTGFNLTSKDKFGRKQLMYEIPFSDVDTEAKYKQVVKQTQPR